VCPPTGEALEAAGLLTIEECIACRLSAHVTSRPICGICQATPRLPGTPHTTGVVGNSSLRADGDPLLGASVMLMATCCWRIDALNDMAGPARRPVTHTHCLLLHRSGNGDVVTSCDSKRLIWMHNATHLVDRRNVVMVPGRGKHAAPGDRSTHQTSKHS